ncbi:putative conserved protein HemY, contains two TPR repeats [Mariprofundus ferrinatatus]|uniref:Putative conserved protein HemY, contains two TPR repeats n=1 Tax=Mariprofundus ferrinatatus TaxID=1921087 RepID=A0A2K8L6K4_9PROT|nr:heme biosynthesis HemY N-terminal domain-containing protein [Mariprofundus ferrinatatus]ATX82863.1 putative conserved protein HemY, contains two TPR repeats [Mariprofundus ferrinatatus]
MRLVFLLVIALATATALIAFPDIADQHLRLEAFGWIFETRQGSFLIALFVLLLLLWLLRSLLQAIFSGPGTVWRSARMGSRKRREKKLREGLAQWLDNRGDFGTKALKRAKGVLPDWVMEMLQVLSVPPKDQKVLSDHEDPLVTVLAARIATDPSAHPKPDLTTRKAHIDTWLHLHPGAPLAISRKADTAEEEGDWKGLVALLEEEWKQGHRSAHSVKPRLANAYIRLSESDTGHAMAHLRKAYRLLPHNHDVLLAYGLGLIVSGETPTAVRLWLSHLEKHDSLDIASALLDTQRADPLRAYRKLDERKESELNDAERWLKAELAHAAKLAGLAFEQMQALAERTNSADAWQSLGNWYAGAGDFQHASEAYQRALEG